MYLDSNILNSRKADLCKESGEIFFINPSVNSIIIKTQYKKSCWYIMLVSIGQNALDVHFGMKLHKIHVMHDIKEHKKGVWLKLI